MREIKFRAWDVDEQSMCDLKFLNLENIKRFQFLIMQFTGLKDKNDTDIYEGDIVKFHYDNGIYKYINAKVMFGSGKFYLRADESGYSLSNNMRIDNSWQIEVIGNIYESPELFGVVEYEVDDEE